MSIKKNPDRFCIKFNPNDSTHQFVIDLLNQLSPRKKTQFIANAILYYTRCSNSSDVMQAVPIDYDFIENIVLDILKKQNVFAQNGVIPDIIQPQRLSTNDQIKNKESAPQDIASDKATISNIINTLSAFRNQ